MYIRGELEPIATGAIESLSVGYTVSLNLVWDTAGYLSGQYNMRIAASTAWDVDASNDSRSVTLNLHNLTTMLAASTPNANGVIGDTIQLAAHVLNHGSSPIEELTVGLYTSHDTAALTTTTIPSIAAGATEIANLDWDTAGQDAGTHHLHISVSAPGISSDVDDTSLVTVTLRNEIDLTGVRQSPDDAIVGNPVTIIAALSNVSLHPVTDATVRLVEAATDRVIFSEKVADLPSTTSTEVPFLWDTSAATAGTHRFRVVVLIPDRHVDSTDALPVNVSLREPAVNVALVDATSTRTERHHRSTGQHYRFGNKLRRNAPTSAHIVVCRPRQRTVSGPYHRRHSNPAKPEPAHSCGTPQANTRPPHLGRSGRRRRRYKHGRQYPYGRRDAV